MQFGTPVLADPNNTIEQAAQTAVEVAEAEVTATGDAQILLNGGYQTVEIYSTIPGAKTTTNGQTDPCAPKTGRPDFAIATVNNRTQSEIADTTLHEFGHGMDDLLSDYVPGNTSDNLSGLAAAAAAIAADIKAMGPEEAQAYAGLDPANIIADLYESSMANSYGRGYDQLGNLTNINMLTMLADFKGTFGVLNDALTAARADAKNNIFKGNRINCPYPDLTPIPNGLAEVQQAQPDITPLILELSNDAVHTTSLNGGIYFDMSNTGFAHQTAWVGANDGILVLDSANDGVIQNGTQLFGNETPLANGTLAATGFAALAQYDTDNSGQINANDSIWSELKVEMGNGSVVSLNSLGITGINLANSAVNVIDANGNNDAYNGSFVYGNGTTGTVADYILQQNTYNSFAISPVPVSNAIAALPDVYGSGTLNDLQQAMQNDNSGVLQGLVQQFVSATSQTTQNSLLSQIIVDWTGVSGVAANAYGNDINGQVYASLAKAYGQNFQFASVGGGTQTNPNQGQGELLNGIYSSFEENVYSELEFGGAISNLAALMENGAIFNSTMDGYNYDLTAVANAIVAQDSTDHNDAQTGLTEFIRALNGSGVLSLTNFQTFQNDVENGATDLTSVFTSNNSLVNPVLSANNVATDLRNDVSAINITLTGSNDSVDLPYNNVVLNAASGNNSFILGNLGNDTITLGSGASNNVQWGLGGAYTVVPTFAGIAPPNDIINMSAGTTNVSSGFGNMIYNVTGAGNDTLQLGSFNDTFNLSAGFGNVSIEGIATAVPTAIEAINFGSGITQNSMVASGSGENFGNLTLSFGSNGTLVLDSVLAGYAGDSENASFAFANGGTYTLQQLLPNGVSDTLAASNNPSYNFSGATIGINFTIAGSNDALILPTTTASTVTLTGSNDVVSGIYGNDSITDNGSKNTFNVTTGQGVIKIGTNDTITGAPSEIKLGGTSLQNDVTFAISSGNTAGLTATLPGSNTLNLNSILNTAGGGNTTLQFSDNSTISLAQFLQSKTFNVANTVSNSSVARTNSFANENITNSGSNDSIYLGTGNDTLTDTGHANVILAGAGTSTINLAANDTLIYSSGHSNIHVNTGSGTTSLQYSDAPVANDNIYFGTGITASSLVLSANGNNAILKIDSAGDQLAITDGFNDHIASLYFSNGSSETYASLLAAGVTVSNTLNNSTVNYTNTIANENITNHGTNDTISLGSGKDTYIETSTKNNIYGGSGNDTYSLNSTASNDTLNLGSGTNNATDSGHNNTIYTVASSGQVHAGTNDSIIVGSGNASIGLGLNDTAYAGTGVTTFTYSKNDGTAVINEGATPTIAGSTDSLTFGAGITSSELTATVNGNELSLAIADGATNDNINIYQELNQGTNKYINAFNFSNNSSLTLAQVLALPIVNNASNTSIYYNGSNANQNYLNNGSNDTLVLSNGNDNYTDNGSTNQIYTGTGNTNTVTLNSVSKNDIVTLSSGQSTVTVNASSTNDSIYLGSGNATVNDSGHNNVVVGSSGNSVISAAANDSLYGGAGNASITLKANDSISTGGGVTTMNYAVNDAYDIIYEGVAPTTAGTTDVLSFGTGITATNLEYHEYGNDLQLTLNDGHPNDVVYIASELNQGSNKVINSFQFSNNSTLTLSQLLGGAHPNVITANPGLGTSSSNATPVDLSSTTNNATPAVASPTSTDSTPPVVSSTSSSPTPAVASPTSSDSTPPVVSSTSSSPTPAVVSPSTNSTPLVVSSTSSSPAPAVISPASTNSTPAVIAVTSTNSSASPTPIEPIPAIVSSTPIGVSVSPAIQTATTPVVAATTETPPLVDAPTVEESPSPPTVAAANIANVYERGQVVELGKHHFAVVKDAMSKFSDKSSGSHIHANSSGSHIHANSSKGKTSVAAHLGKWGAKNDKESATTKADKYALYSGKFLTGADYALTVQSLAAFAAEKSEYSGAAAKHNSNHELAQLAIGHH